MSAVVRPELRNRLSCRACREGLGLHELLRPRSQRVVVRLTMIEDRVRAHDDHPQISIARARFFVQQLGERHGHLGPVP